MTAATTIHLEDAASSITDKASPIAYIVSRFPRLTETFILREIIELEQRGQPVIVYPLLSVQQSVRHAETSTLSERICYTPYISQEVFAANLQCLRRSPGKYLRTFFRVVWGNRGSFHLWIRGLVLFPKFVRIAQLIDALGAKHIHAHFATHPALAAMVISGLTGIGYSFTAHAHDIFVHTTMLREKIERARFVVTISEYNKHYLHGLVPGIQNANIHVVRCGIDPGRYALQLSPRRINKKHSLRILCVASLEPYKGIEHLIRACARLRHTVPGFRCEIIGDGSNRIKLSTLIRELHLEQQVHLIGPCRQDEVAERLRQADLFVLPSVVARDGQMEGIPVALMEAMASGLPVVASRLSGIPELVDHDVNGLLVTPGDEIQLSEALELLCLNKDLRKQFGLHGREKVARDFNINESVNKLESLFCTAYQLDSIENQNNTISFSKLADEIQKIPLKGISRLGVGESQIKLEPLHPTTDGHDSLVYAVRGDHLCQELILKRHQPRQEPDRAELCSDQEHRVLKYLEKELSKHSSRFSVPKVLAFFPQNHSLMMEKCTGETFAQHLRWARLRHGSRGNGELFRGAAACGEWLGVFHTATRHPIGNHTAIQHEIDRMFRSDLHACALLGLEESIVSRALEFFEHECKAVFTAVPELTGHHGDYGPQNVFLSPERIMVIDFEGFRTGFPGEDLADFLVILSLLPFYHAGARLRLNLRRAFLDGYARHCSFEVKSSIKFFELQALVKRMAHNPHFTLSTSGKHRWRRGLLLNSYRRYFEFLLP